MKDGRNASVFGIIILVIGVLLLLSNLGWIRFGISTFWSAIIVFMGLFFHYLYFSGNRTNPEVLVPGGILTTIGLLFMVNALFGWHLMKVLWPLFILSPAVGLFEYYVFGDRQKGLLIPISILTGLTGLFLLNNLANMSGGIIFSIVLILVGLVIIISSSGGNKY